MHIEQLDPATLTAYGRNSRTHSAAQVAQICASITEFGFTNPLLIDDRNRIIAGHGRHQAAASLGLTAVPCLRLSGLTEPQLRAYVIADNKLAENAGWDQDMLKLEMGELKELGYDLQLLGFDEEELGELLSFDDPASGLTDPDAVPDVPVEPTTRTGDLYQLGRHRLLCGDSTNIEDVHRLMGGGKCDICFTSPPYGAANVSKIRKHYVAGAATEKSFYNQHEDNPDDWLSLMNGWYAAARENCDVIICNVQMLADNKFSMMEWLHNTHSDLCDIIVWDKGHGAPQMQWNILNNAFEFIFIMGGNGSRSVPFGEFHGSVSNIVRINPQGKNTYSKIHRAVMPTELALWVLQTLCAKSKSVYDPFSGTGTTIIAAEQTGNKCYGMELDPKYCDVIVTRWEQFTGKKAELLPRNS